MAGAAVALEASCIAGQSGIERPAQYPNGRHGTFETAGSFLRRQWRDVWSLVQASPPVGSVPIGFTQ